MNAGTDRKKALEQAWANAQSDNRPRFVHCYNGTYWVEKSPPKPGPMAGAHGSDYVVVSPSGLYQSYDPTQGAKDVDLNRPADQGRDPQGQDHH